MSALKGLNMSLFNPFRAVGYYLCRFPCTSYRVIEIKSLQDFNANPTLSGICNADPNFGKNAKREKLLKLNWLFTVLLNYKFKGIQSGIANAA